MKLLLLRLEILLFNRDLFCYKHLIEKHHKRGRYGTFHKCIPCSDEKELKEAAKHGRRLSRIHHKIYVALNPPRVTGAWAGPR